jgi:carbon storage regulator
VLVLTRELYDRIIIGNNIVVTVLSINGGKSVRIGVEAPNAVPVHRHEVYDEIQRDLKDGAV